MASIAMNKLKSKLTTRNQFTGKAMDRMTKDNLRELFQGDLNYMSWEKTYLQRRFHPDEYLKQLREHRREIFEKQRTNSPNSEIDYEKLLLEEEQHDIELQKRFKTFSELHNGDKAILILDVDNTMVYVRFFSEEMQIGDIVTYFASESVTKNNGKIGEVRLTLSLDISNNTLIDKLGSERMICNYWATTNELLKKYKKKNGVFDYELEDGTKIGCKIRKVEVTGCRVEVRIINMNEVIEDEDEDMNMDRDDIAIAEIDFTNGNENLSKLEPMLERPGMSAVDFIFEGFLVRLRPNLDEFLEYCNDDYDVVIYTSANKLIYEGLLQVLHEYVKDQLGREDEEDLSLWSEVLYRDDCTLDYNEKGKPYHHKDLTLFGCDLSRVIMIDNSPIVCRGEEPNFILIKDYFGKDNMDDELMEVYQMLDAMIEIEGDVRYFLCGLDNEQNEALDLSTEDLCWEWTEKLMKELDAYYSEQIALSPVSSGYVTEEEEAYMDDYDDDDIPDREKMLSMHSSPIPQDIKDIGNETNESQSNAFTNNKTEVNIDIINENETEEDDNYDTKSIITVNTDNTRITHSANTSSVLTPKQIETPSMNMAHHTPQSEKVVETMKKSPYQSISHHAGTEPNTPNTMHLNDNASISTITITDMDESDVNIKKKKGVQFAAPSINTNAPRDNSLSFSQSGKTQSAKGNRYKEYTAGRYKKSQSARFKKGLFSDDGNLKEHFKRNKSLLLDPQKLDSMTKRHARYSSMSPRYIWGLDKDKKHPQGRTFGNKSVHKLSVNDLSINDAIHSFGAVDTDEDDDANNGFFSAKQIHEHTKSSLTIDSKRYSKVEEMNSKVPKFNVNVDNATGDNDEDVKEHKSDDMKDKSELEDGFIPPPNFNRRKSMKTLDQIKSEKLRKREKRLSQKRNSSIKLYLKPMDKYKYDRERKKQGTHRRGFSSDAIGNIDFDVGGFDVRKSKPGKKRHKISIADTKQFGKVWRNTMAPRPTAQKIVTSSKHDEFILLFQQQLKDIKQEQIEQYQRKQSHVNNLEKRKSVPDFAMLSEIDSEADILAHKLRLSTLREEQITGLTFSQTNTLDSVNEKQTMENINPKNSNKNNKPESKQKLLDDDGNKISDEDMKLMDDWDKNISPKHGCCYYFCCCCICNIFTGNNVKNTVNYSPR